jgi:hypothetical protein
MKLLIGILCIDRDHKNIPKLYQSLPKNDIIVLTRKQDKKTIKKFSVYKNVKIITIDNYEIKDGERHNMNKIIEKRRCIMKYAIDYDNLLFVDSDIVLYDGIIDDMIKCRENKDTVVVGVYKIKWMNKAVVMTINDGIIQVKEFKNLTNNDNILIAGFGRCLIPKSAFNIPIEYKSIIIGKDKDDKEVSMSGEDFGWFLNLHSSKFIVKPLLTREIEHNITEYNL